MLYTVTATTLKAFQHSAKTALTTLRKRMQKNLATAVNTGGSSERDKFHRD